MNSLAGAKPAEYALLILLCDCLGSAQCAGLGDREAGEEVDPNQQLRLPFVRSRQRWNVVHCHNLERVRRLDIPR